MKKYTTSCKKHMASGADSSIPPMHSILSMQWRGLFLSALALSFLGVLWFAPQALAAEGTAPPPNPMKALVGLYAIIAGIHTFLYKRATHNSPDPEAYSRGITGWLLFFLLAFTGSFFISLVMDGSENITAFLEETGENYFWGLCFLVLLQVFFYSFWVYTLYSLWRKKSTAIRLAKRCLLLLLLYATTMPSIALLLFWATARTFALSDINWGDLYDMETNFRIAQTFFFCTIWFYYLSVSKRVRLTYQTSPPAQPEMAE